MSFVVYFVYSFRRKFASTFNRHILYIMSKPAIISAVCFCNEGKKISRQIKTEDDFLFRSRANRAANNPQICGFCLVLMTRSQGLREKPMASYVYSHQCFSLNVLIETRRSLGIRF